MTEKLPVTQNTVDVNMHARAEEGRALERRSPLVPMPHMGAQSTTKPSFAITPGKLREALFFRWKLALLVGLILAAVGAGLAWITYKPKYTAAASFYLIPSKPPLLPGTPQPEDRRDREEFQKSHAYMVRSWDVLRTVLKKDDVRALPTIRDLENPASWLAVALQAGFIGGTDICRISLSGENPEDLALIVNTVKDVYIAQIVNGTRRGEADHYEEIEKAMERVDERIRKQLGEIRDMVVTDRSLGTADPKVLQLRQTMAVEEFALAKRELSSIKSQIRKTKAQLVVVDVQIKNSDNQPVPAESIEEYIDSHPEVKAEQEQIANLERRIHDLRKIVTATSPRLRELQGELNEGHARLQKLKSRVRPYVAPIIQKALQKKQRDSMAEAKGLMTVLNEERDKLEEDVIKLKSDAEKLGISSFDLEAKIAEKAETEGSLKRFRAEKERLELEKLNNSSTVSSVQTAEVPAVNEASLLKTGGQYGLIGLLLGFLGVSFFEARLHRVHKPAEVRQNLGIHTLGVLPLLTPKGAGAYGRALPGKESLPGIVFTDAVDALCASLQCDDRLSRSKVIMVTSAGEDEGKTLLAMQLAAGFARSGQRTLFLDCDFRNSRCQKQLGLAVGPGLSEVLRGEAELPNALQTLPDTEARILPAGKCNPQVVKALSNGTFAALLARLRQDFDCIIVDSAPTPVIADGLLIGKLADGVILVVRSNVSKAPAVVAAYEQLAALKIVTLGAVVNGSPDPSSRRYYAG
jgi:succinoglycan biosynthesis transport protein ExoP